MFTLRDHGKSYRQRNLRAHDERSRCHRCSGQGPADQGRLLCPRHSHHAEFHRHSHEDFFIDPCSPLTTLPQSKELVALEGRLAKAAEDEKFAVAELLKAAVDAQAAKDAAKAAMDFNVAGAKDEELKALEAQINALLVKKTYFPYQ